MSAKRIARKLVSILVLGVIIIVVYFVVREVVSRRILNEAMKIAGQLSLTEEEQEILPGMIEKAHEKAFAQTFHILETVGERFEGEAYQRELFRGVIEDAKSRGLFELADKLVKLEKRTSFHVVER
ncbi:MAG: hypothetical protein JSV78_06520 [Phycisphaerales bacterium]|nr:MAG: hypothetical protein JSV78_06520 [Phycisphaerales bacterium]